MNYSRFAVCLILALAIALFASCGGRQMSSTNGTLINSAIAELDAMQTPKGADPVVFNQLKDAVRGLFVQSIALLDDVDLPPPARGLEDR